MKKILEFMRRERLYLLLLAFIIVINVIMMTEGSDRRAGAKKAAEEVKAAIAPAAGTEDKAKEILFMKREEVESALAKNKRLAALFSLSSLLITAVLLLGIMIDILLISRRVKNMSPEIHSYNGPLSRCVPWDVAKVVILFLFFGYMLIIIEALSLRSLPALKDDDFRMMVNTSILDVLAVVFIIYFTAHQYKDSLASIGLSLKNFVKNVFYGIVGYIAAVPLLVAVLLLVALVVSLTKYVPEKQMVVEMFLREKNVPFLIYSAIFTGIIGPIIEELFFRGFMYNAFKKRIGIFWAMFITSAIFASLHSNLVSFFPILALGFVLAYMYEKTGTIVSSVTVHMVHNLGMVFLLFMMKEIKP